MECPFLHLAEKTLNISISNRRKIKAIWYLSLSLSLSLLYPLTSDTSLLTSFLSEAATADGREDSLALIVDILPLLLLLTFPLSLNL